MNNTIQQSKAYQEAYEMIRVAHEEELPDKNASSTDNREWAEGLISEAKKLCFQAVEDYLNFHQEDEEV